MNRYTRQGTRHRLEGGMIAFRWNGRGDVRGYLPPKGYEAMADLTEYHPVSGAFLGASQWWMFLKPKGGGIMDHEAELLREARSAIREHPSLHTHIIELYRLAMSEIDEGESPAHEYELFVDGLNELKQGELT